VSSPKRLEPIITLTTDFGTESPYTAAMKGVIFGVNPDARLIDLTHQIGPQNLRHAAFFLAGAIPYFPMQTVHVIVVDPGVGTERPLLYVNVAGHRLLVPDNGCWTELARRIGVAPEVIILKERRFWRESVSSTFHGKDILSPVAGHLSLGIDPHELGPAANRWEDLILPSVLVTESRIQGEVLFVDHFGNMITNITRENLERLGEKISVRVGKTEICRQVRTYGEAEPGAVVTLISSFGLLEIAERNGNVSKRLNAEIGTPVVVTSK
jgi:S-adenosylmethionine hydrolase